MFQIRANASQQRVQAASAPAAITFRLRVTPGRRIIGIFGGSFDPPTLSHLHRIRELVTTFRQNVIGANGAPTKRRLDELWVVPVYQHANPEKRVAMTPFASRVHMLELGLVDHLGAATKDKAGLRISRIEARIGGISQTFDTLTALRAAHPDCDFVVYFGADLRNDVGKLKAFDAIQRMACVQFLSRAGYDNTDAVGAPLPEMSSTEFRNAVSGGDLEAAVRLTDPRIFAFLQRSPALVDGYISRSRKRILGSLA